MLHPVFQFVPEGAVALIDIEVILLKKIIGHIDIWIPVLIDVSDGHPQSETDDAAIDACFPIHFAISAIVIPIEMIPTPLEHIRKIRSAVRDRAHVRVVQRIDGNGAVVHHKTVEIAVQVIIKEGGVGGISIIVQPIFRCPFRECQIMVVDE